MIGEFSTEVALSTCTANVVRTGLLLGLLSCGGDPSAPDDGPTVASVTVLPAVDSIIIGDTAQFRAEARDSAGNLITGRTVTWSAFQSPALPGLASINRASSRRSH